MAKKTTYDIQFSPDGGEGPMPDSSPAVISSSGDNRIAAPVVPIVRRDTRSPGPAPVITVEDLEAAGKRRIQAGSPPAGPPPEATNPPATVDKGTRTELRIGDLRDKEARANITKFYTEENAELERAARVAREKNAGKIPPEIFNDIIAARKKALPAFIDDVAKITSSTPDGRPVSQEWIKQQTQAASDRMNALVTAEVIKANRARHPDMASTQDLATLDKYVNGAFYATEKEAPSKGFLGGALGKAGDYIEKTSTSGMIGGAIGLIAGFFLTGGSGLMGIISTVALAIGGLYLGNKYSEMKESKPAATPPATTTPKPADKQGDGKRQEKEYTSLIDDKPLPKLEVSSDSDLLAGGPANTPLAIPIPLVTR